MLKLCSTLVACAVVWAAVAQGSSHRGGCPHCGCATVKKICRLKPDVKKEKKYVYSCECEDFCVPGRSEQCGFKWVCDENGHRHKEIVWKPTCARVRTKAKLLKKEVVHEKKTFKWVVEEVCCQCHECVSEAEAASPATAAAEESDAGDYATLE